MLKKTPHIRKNTSPISVKNIVTVSSACLSLHLTASSSDWHQDTADL